MNVLHAIVLGAVQGLTEFLPVSSSGHLIFFPKLFGWPDQGLAFDVVLHVGTLFAVVVYFRKKLIDILKSIFPKKSLITNHQSPVTNTEARMNQMLALYIFLSTVPALIIGFFFSDWIETSLRSPVVIAYGLIGWGIMLGWADIFARKQTSTQASRQSMNWKTAFFIGCAQAIALIPGTSRSGITMTAGLFAGLSRSAAAEFSFLMSIPVIAIAGAVKTFELFQNGLGDIGVLPLVAGFLTSFVFGFSAIWGLMKIIQKWSFLPFVLYRVAVGILILVLFL
ncbi:MAG: undecaprenyl-diphosphate phosphatase [Patescibacteria group bacterium]